MKYLILVLLILAPYVGFGQSQNPSQDSLLFEKYHQFDFWLGDWDVYRYGTDTLVGISKIESVVDSFGVLENYRSAKGNYQGKSLNKYNPDNDRWEQFWIDNRGLTLKLEGELRKGKMVLENRSKTKKGTVLNRITWQVLEDQKVRQTWEVSENDGKTWQSVFDGLYQKSRR